MICSSRTARGVQESASHSLVKNSCKKEDFPTVLLLQQPNQALQDPASRPTDVSPASPPLAVPLVGARRHRAPLSSRRAARTCPRGGPQLTCPVPGGARLCRPPLLRPTGAGSTTPDPAANPNHAQDRREVKNQHGLMSKSSPPISTLLGTG